jgi:hypothetical protein
MELTLEAFTTRVLEAEDLQATLSAASSTTLAKAVGLCLLGTAPAAGSLERTVYRAILSYVCNPEYWRDVPAAREALTRAVQELWVEAPALSLAEVVLGEVLHRLHGREEA